LIARLPGKQASASGISPSTDRSTAFLLSASARKSVLFYLLLILPSTLGFLYLLTTLDRFSLWLDEAWVAESVIRTDITTDTLQSTPIGFFLVLKVLTHIFGTSEFGFRLASSAFFVAAIITTAILARHLFRQNTEALMAAFLLGTNFAAIIYAQNTKAYTADVFFAALIPILALRITSRTISSRWLVYGLALVIAPLFSFPALVVALSSGVFLLVTGLQRTDRMTWFRCWITTHAAAAVCVLVYGLTLLRSQRSDGLLAYWASGFPPDGLSATLVWTAHQVWGLLLWFFTPLSFGGPGERVLKVVVAALVAVGIVAFAYRRPSYLIVLVAPAVMLLVTAVMHLYPFDPALGGRLLLCLLPTTCILLVGGLGWTLRHTPIANMPRALALGAFLVTLVISSDGLYGILANRDLPSVPREELRELVALYLLPQLRQGDAVYVYYGAVEAFDYYAPSLKLEHQDTDWVPYTTSTRNGIEVAYGGEHRNAPAKYGAELVSSMSHTPGGRTWIVLSHISPGEEDALIAPVAQRGLLNQVWRQPGAALYLIHDEQGAVS
jgi:4-amino-4-deoxy-L-arabinose transferase-like glycosyltransferase